MKLWIVPIIALLAVTAASAITVEFANPNTTDPYISPSDTSTDVLCAALYDAMYLYNNWYCGIRYDANVVHIDEFFYIPAGTIATNATFHFVFGLQPGTPYPPYEGFHPVDLELPSQCVVGRMNNITVRPERHDWNEPGVMTIYCLDTNDTPVDIYNSGMQFNYWQYPNGLTMGVEQACTPNWSCSGFANCSAQNVSECLNVTDANLCGENFGGTLSDYDAACVYVPPCLPSWTCSNYEACSSQNVTVCLAVSDVNQCGEQFGGVLADYNGVCEYQAPCTPVWHCTSLGACQQGDARSCLAVADEHACGEQFGGSLSSYDEACVYVPPQTGNNPLGTGGSVGGSAPQQPVVAAVGQGQSGVTSTIGTWFTNFWDWIAALWRK